MNLEKADRQECLSYYQIMKLVFLHGPPAAGKLTIGRELEALTNFSLFHNHLTVDLVSSLFLFGSEPFIRLREQIWLAAFAEAARNDVSLIFTFAPEHTVPESFVQKTIDLVTAAGGQVIFVQLICSEDELDRRVKEASRKELGKLSSVEQYRSLRKAGAFQFPKLPNGLILDVTILKPAESAQLIRDYIEST